MSYYSIADYKGDGATTQFAVPFPYLDASNVSVLVAGVSTSFTWVNSGQISLSSAPASGTSVRIQRTTPRSTEEVTFADGSVETAADLNTALVQLLYIAQENFDQSADTLATIGHIVASSGNVPTPVSPTNDNMVLQAINGSFGWSSSVSLSSVSAGSLTVSGTTTLSGVLNSSQNVYTTGSLNAAWITSTGSVVAAAVSATGTTSGSMILAVTDTTVENLVRWQKTASGVGVSTAANPTFDLYTSGGTSSSLIMAVNSGSGYSNAWIVDNGGASNAARFVWCAPIIPQTDNAIDIGTTSLRIRNIYMSGGIFTGAGATNQVNVVTGVRFNTTTGELEVQTTPAIVCAGPLPWTAINPDSDYYGV